MLLPKLDERLQTAYDLFPTCEWAADVGCDHGRLPLHLLAADKAERMIVSDISPQALAKGKELISRWGYGHRAVFCAADGLNCLDRTVEAVSILGMGGETIETILAKGKSRLKGACLILSGHTELEKIRQAVAGIDYHLAEERLCKAAGRLYVVMRAEPGEKPMTEKELWLGPCLIREKQPLWPEYLAWRSRVAETALKAIRPDDPRGESLRRMLTYLREEM